MSIKTIIAPSMLASDLARLADESRRMAECGADWLHMDVMDGHFVPNMTFGAPVIKALRKHVPGAVLDCHLMVDRPEDWIDDMAAAGASGLTFHVEATKDAKALAMRIKKLGIRAGLAIRPRTPLDPELLELCSHFDLILVMSVEPGFGGQAFMPETMDKVKTLRSTYAQLDIEVDGGVNAETIAEVAAAGANVIVSGTGIFKFPDGPAAAVALLRETVQRRIRAA